MLTPTELLARRRGPPRLIIFDCDGVIVDSEPISNRIIAEDLTARGLPMTGADAERRYIGITLPDIQPIVEAELGRALPADWPALIAARIVPAMATEAIAIPGAVEALRAVTEMGLAWRVASNSSHAEMRAKFGALGIADLVAGRIHSHEDVARGKPWPELFLATAAAGGAKPGDCLVIEDSVAGATAARAADMDCLGLDRHGDGARLRAVGAAPFHAMAELPGLVAAALARAA